jgi:hypothetical protein
MAVDFDALDLVRTQNRAEMHERKKIKFLEDRIKVLEKTLESHAKILARFQMTEGKDDIDIYETVGGGFEVGDNNAE